MVDEESISLPSRDLDEGCALLLRILEEFLTVSLVLRKEMER